MSILNRISTILRSNINDLLDRAEDPEKMLNQVLRDMGEAIKEARDQVIEEVAQAKLLEEDLKQANRLSQQWQQKAQLAVDKGADELARECLRHKLSYDANAQSLGPRLAAQQSAAAALKGGLSALESKHSELARNREALIARYKRARAQDQIQKRLATVSISDPTGTLRRMEDRIRIMEARVQAQGEVALATPEARLNSLAVADSELEVEAALLLIKAKTTRQLPAPLP